MLSQSICLFKHLIQSSFCSIRTSCLTLPSLLVQLKSVPNLSVLFIFFQSLMSQGEQQSHLINEASKVQWLPRAQQHRSMKIVEKNFIIGMKIQKKKKKMMGFLSIKFFQHDVTSENYDAGQSSEQGDLIKLYWPFDYCKQVEVVLGCNFLDRVVLGCNLLDRVDLD